MGDVPGVADLSAGGRPRRRRPVRRLLRKNGGVSTAEHFADREPEGWEPPPVRAEALLWTWSMMLLGHVLVTLLAIFALVGGSPDRTGTALIASLAVLVLGLVGGALAWRGLSVTRTVRRAERAGARPRPPHPSLLVLAGGLAVLAVGIAVIVVVQWGAAAILPTVGGELVFLPLALRTQRYAEDVAGAMPPDPAVAA